VENRENRKINKTKREQLENPVFPVCIKTKNFFKKFYKYELKIKKKKRIV